jgi:TRAP-type C4-dicarboxylate transport system permease small subunit
MSVLLDRATRWGAALGAALIGFVALINCMETILRYVFNAPTIWVSAVSGYGLAASVMLCAPLLTAEKGHVAMDLLARLLPPVQRRNAELTTGIASALMCGIAAAIVLVQCWVQFESGETTSDSLRIPRFWLSLFMVFGLGLSAVQFLRLGWRPAAPLEPVLPDAAKVMD